MFEFGDTFKEQADYALFWVLAIDAVFLAAITFCLVYFSYRYHKTRNPKPTNIEGHIGLEVIWTVIPTIIVMWFFYIGWEGYKTDRTVPDDAMIVEVTAYKWGWNFKYPNGKTSDHIYIPVNKPVKFVLHTKDVVHGFYLPEFRTKRDVMPGYENYVWIKPEEKGEFNLYCTEYCGLSHWNMNRKVFVISEEEYNVWLNTAPEHLSGPEVYTKHCAVCHSNDGASKVGPTFKGLFGKQEAVNIDGAVTDVEVTREYIVESIKLPGAAVVEGFGNAMPSFEGTLSEKEIENVTDYIESLK